MTGSGTVPSHPARTAASRGAAGRDNREICRKLLSMGTEETERLIADRVPFGPA